MTLQKLSRKNCNKVIASMALTQNLMRKEILAEIPDCNYIRKLDNHITKLMGMVLNGIEIDAPIKNRHEIVIHNHSEFYFRVWKRKLKSKRITWQGNYGTVTIPIEAVQACYTQGSNDLAVAHWVKSSDIEWDMSPDKIRSELSQYGAWNAEELADDQANRERLLWSACWDIRETSGT